MVATEDPFPTLIPLGVPIGIRARLDQHRDGFRAREIEPSALQQKFQL
jgi:hypothetical protein